MNFIYVKLRVKIKIKWSLWPIHVFSLNLKTEEIDIQKYKGICFI